jgi:hypothetical protein
MSTCTTPSTVVCEELFDRDAETKCAIMPHDFQIEGIVDNDGSTKFVSVSLPLEIGKDGCSTVTFTSPDSYEEIMNESAHTLDAPNMEVQVVQQNPCENESYIAKLSTRENKSELCDSTKCEIESILRETHHTKIKSLNGRCVRMFMNLTYSFILLVLSSKICRFARKLSKGCLLITLHHLM